MPRIYCSRYPSYTLWNRDVRYQFKDGVCEVDEAGLAFFRHQPMWGRLFSEAPAPEAPPNPLLWKVDMPKPLPPVPPRPPENPMDTPLSRMLGWPYLPVPGSSRQLGQPSRQPAAVRLSQGEILGHGVPVPDLLRERTARAPERHGTTRTVTRPSVPPVLPDPQFVSRKRQSPKSDRAAAWLKSLLRDRRLPSTWVIGQAKLARISKRTLDRACQALGIVVTKAGMTGGWAWSLPVTLNGDLRERPANVKRQ
jgi:hypothetical protein